MTKTYYRRRRYRARSHRTRSTRKSGGAKMGPEMKAWSARMHRATGKIPISKSTLDALKPKQPPNGSAQREEAAKYSAAQSRGKNAT